VPLSYNSVLKNNYIILTPDYPSIDSFRWSFIHDQVKAIQRTGNYRMTVFVPKQWYLIRKDYEFEGVTVHYFSVFELPSNILPGLFNWFSKLSFLFKLKALGVQLKDVEIVHAHVSGLGFFANVIKKINAEIKTVLQHHGFDVLSMTSGRLSKYNWHRQWVKNNGIKICNQIDLHVGVSNQTLNYLRNYKGIKLKDTYKLYNGVDPDKFYRIEGLKNKDCYTIGCIGNFWEIKDQITLIKSAEKLINDGAIDIRVILIGSGVLLSHCKNYVIDNNLSEYIEFRDELPHKDLCQFYNTLNIFVLPSYYEAFGCVYTEAYSCGVPFIGVKGQGIEELILPENMHYQLVGARQVDELSNKIKYFYRNRDFNPQLNQSIAINDLVEDFLNMLKKNEIYNKV
jgi:glycosyltransferase involved in cell wall biosynthesis